MVQIQKICVSLHTTMDNCIGMDEIYEKLLEQLRTMTPEQKNAEWEALKDYNIGPSMEEYMMLMMDYQPTSVLNTSVEYNSNIPQVDVNSNKEYYLAA